MPTSAPAAGTLARRGAVALALAVVVNVALVAAADAAGVAPALDPLSYGPVVLFTAVGVAGAVVAYAALTRTVANPDRTFLLLVLVVLVLSWIPDVTYAPSLPGATTAGVALLALMHLTAAAVAVAALTERYRPG